MGTEGVESAAVGPDGVLEACGEMDDVESDPMQPRRLRIAAGVAQEGLAGDDGVLCGEQGGLEGSEDCELGGVVEFGGSWDLYGGHGLAAC